MLVWSILSGVAPCSAINWLETNLMNSLGALSGCASACGMKFAGLYQIWCFKTSVSGTYLHTHPLFLNIPKTLPSVIFSYLFHHISRLGKIQLLSQLKMFIWVFFVRSNGKSQTNFLANLVLLSPLKKCLESSFPLNFDMKGSFPLGAILHTLLTPSLYCLCTVIFLASFLKLNSW